MWMTKQARSIVVATSSSDWVSGIESTGRRTGSRLDASMPWIVSRVYLHAPKYVTFLWTVTTLMAVIVVIFGHESYGALLAPVLVCGPAFLAAIVMRDTASAPGVYFLKEGIQIGSDLVGWARVRSIDISRRSLKLVYGTARGTRTVRRTIAQVPDQISIHIEDGSGQLDQSSARDSYR